jgi:ABC-type Fe3+ transport system permease subunit
MGAAVTAHTWHTFNDTLYNTSSPCTLPTKLLLARERKGHMILFSHYLSFSVYLSFSLSSEVIGTGQIIPETVAEDRN